MPSKSWLRTASAKLTMDSILPPSAQNRLLGRAASPGLASGLLYILRDRNASARVGTNDPARERFALQSALGAAAASLGKIASTATGDGAAILGFQLALIEDEALSKPAFDAILTGASAENAWIAAMNAELVGYEQAQDEHFRARASDLKDLRDRVLGHLASDGASTPLPPAGSVIVATDLPPSQFLAIDWSKGGAILLTGGSPMSHVAMLAKARGVPMIVGLDASLLAARGTVLVDGQKGEVIVDPDAHVDAQFQARLVATAQALADADRLRTRPAQTKDGTRIAIHLNITDVRELEGLDPAICDGIGLVRTEFLFTTAATLHDETSQYEVYRKIVQWAAGRPVTIRTLDAGGDKPIPEFTVEGESNPFLGLRGIRLSLRHPETLRTQLRALIRAAAHGPIKIMLPMVTVPAELNAARGMLNDEVQVLVRQGIAVRQTPLGIMVEVPATALSISDFAADFFSIGSNDLTQYATAAGRDIGAVAELANPLHPGVLRLMEAVVLHGRKQGLDVSLCGDAGGEPALIARFLQTGLRSFSMSPSLAGRVKAAIAEVDLREFGPLP